MYPPDQPYTLESLPAVGHSLPVRLMRAREAVMARFRPILRAHGLTEQQWRVVRTMRESGETEVTVLAGLVFLLPPSLSRILRDLEQRRLVERRASPQDQRRYLVSLTQAGEQLMDETLPEMVREAERIRRSIGVANLTQLFMALDALEASLEPAVPGAEAD